MLDLDFGGKRDAETVWPFFKSGAVYSVLVLVARVPPVVQESDLFTPNSTVGGTLAAVLFSLDHPLSAITRL